jgi:hypothetical protein
MLVGPDKKSVKMNGAASGGWSDDRAVEQGNPGWDIVKMEATSGNLCWKAPGSPSECSEMLVKESGVG